MFDPRKLWPVGPSPILTLIKRELLTSLRSWKSLILLLVLLAVLYYVVYDALDHMSMNVFSIPQVMRSIFNVQVGLLLFAALTIVPTTAAVSLTKERADGSYDLLLTTLIPPGRIAWGKLAATLILFLLIAVALLPFTGLVYFFAGVDVYRFFQAATVILPTALGSAALGIWASTLFTNPSRAIFVTFGAIFFVCAVFPALLSWYFDSRLFVTVLSPFPLLTNRGSWSADWSAYGYYAAYQGLIALIAMGGALFNLGRFQLLRPLKNLAGRLPARGRRKFSPIRDKENPVAAREAFSSSVARRVTGRIVFGAVLVAYCYVILRIFRGGEEEVIIAATMGERLLLLVLVPAVTAVSWVRDREETTWDMLRLSLLRSQEVFIGKVLGVLRALWPVFGPVYLVNCTLLFILAVEGGRPDRDTWVMSFLGELIFLPVHGLMVIIAAMVGATFTKSITTGIAAAYGCLAAGVMTFGITTGTVMAGSRGEVTAFIFFHIVLCGFALFVGGGIVAARIEHLWQSPALNQSPRQNDESVD